MYYKIENKASDVYQELYNMRSEEIAIEKRNVERIKNKLGDNWTEDFVGYRGQLNFYRCTIFSGFKPKDESKVDLKVWRKDDAFPDFYVPNLRTKKGKEMETFLENLDKSYCGKPLEILGFEPHGKFNLPYVEIGKEEVIVIYLDNKYIPKDENVIEITSIEFNELLEI